MRQNKWVWIEHPDHILLPVKMVALHGQEIEAHSAEGEVYSLQNGADYPEVQVHTTHGLLMFSRLCILQEFSHITVMCGECNDQLL